MRGEERGTRDEATHVIRLRGPWVDGDGRRVKLPAVWQDAFGDADRATLTRSFNRPTNLDEPGVSVRLRIESPQEAVRILLNGSDLVDGSELVDLLALSNHLEVTLARRDPAAGVLEAQLEITES